MSETGLTATVAPGIRTVAGPRGAGRRADARRGQRFVMQEHALGAMPANPVALAAAAAIAVALYFVGRRLSAP